MTQDFSRDMSCKYYDDGYNFLSNFNGFSF
nr:MAG TPA: hypothetical protein [Caudoviricetes sp.]